MKREPIQTPFLSKSKESDYNDSLAIFKLILRFMNDDALESGKREKVKSLKSRSAHFRRDFRLATSVFACLSCSPNSIFSLRMFATCSSKNKTYTNSV